MGSRTWPAAAVLALAVVVAATPGALGREATSVGASAAALADPPLGPGCVTRAEFRQASPGTRKWRVHQAFGAVGRVLVVRSERRYSRWYTQCRPARGYDECRLSVDFRVGPEGAARVEGKAWAIYCSSG